MNPIEIRKKYLKLLSRLYDLTADYSKDDLRMLRDFARGENNRQVESAVLLLLQLQGEGGVSHRAADSVEPEETLENRPRNYPRRRRERALREMLMSREIFKTTPDISKSIPIYVEVKPKESRERYVNKILTRFRELDEVQQKQFIDGIQGLIAASASGSFVSRWSKLIKDL